MGKLQRNLENIFVHSCWGQGNNEKLTEKNHQLLRTEFVNIWCFYKK